MSYVIIHYTLAADILNYSETMISRNLYHHMILEQLYLNTIFTHTTITILLPLTSKPAEYT
jgi:hypothetical protein